MDNVNINPGIKRGMKQPFTIMTGGRIYFLSHDESTDAIVWNMFMDDSDLKINIEKMLRSYLTNH